ncbi:zinc finger transcription factor [Lithospermum erythrorhizon]|uniref:Zinc finger transcription factor n=1 Tax=Lithospermum erythrorhizon TaxID=34254 RepID=A0AAV3QPI9_LITER
MVDEEDLLNFELDIEDNKTQTNNLKKDLSCFSSLASPNQTLSNEFEEELEWLDNKDAFPTLESCLEIFSDNPSIELDHHSPISVLENSSISNNSENNGSGEEKSNGSTITSFCGSLVPRKFPVGKRTKGGRRGRTVFSDLTTKQNMWLDHVNVKARKQIWALELPPVPVITNKSSSIGRRCLHCQADKTPQWRAGPMGPKTLCNACGVRYKSGRLVPEYRPANSPTFSPVAHSNSHRKIMEMRKQKGGNDGLNQACGYNSVG